MLQDFKKNKQHQSETGIHVKIGGQGLRAVFSPSQQTWCRYSRGKYMVEITTKLKSLNYYNHIL